MTFLPIHRDRRARLLQLGALALFGIKTAAAATTHSLAELRGRGLANEGVLLDLPPLSDNGNSVPLQFSLTAPPGRMIAGFEIIAPENPNPVVLRLKLHTALSRYQFSTRIRLAMSQEIWVVSLLDDGSQRGSSLHTVVTDTACFDET